MRTDLIYDETADPETRLNAVTTLGKLSRIGELLSLARNEKMIRVMRLTAAITLGHLGQISEAASILLVQDDGASPWERVRIAEALLLFGQIDVAASILLSVAGGKNQEEWIRLEAIETLGKIDRAVVTPVVLTGLRALAENSTESEEVRRIAWLILQRLEGQEDSG